jgi:hypothetical protein
MTRPVSPELVAEGGQVRFADTRLFMALCLGAAMGVIMLAFMLGMYHNRRANVAIFTAASIVFVPFPVPRARTRFMALAGVMTSATFLLVSVVQTVALFLITPCAG